MIKSIAAYLCKINQPLKIEEIYVPDPEIGQVLVKIICSSICGRQIQR